MDQGIAVNTDLDEYLQCANLFERRLHSYKLKARAFQSNSKYSEERFDADMKHLEAEEAHLLVLADVFAQQEAMRSSARGSINETAAETRKRANDLESKDHHPTVQLEQNMRADGRPKPSRDYTAHHIVPGKGRTKVNYLTRIRMHTLGVAINDGNNGAWMIQKTDYKPHWFAGEAASHKRHHTEAYEVWLSTNIRSTKTENALRAFLRNTGSRMENGELQPEDYRN
jgi:hypothetical protein